ncbi:DUF6445 family protein [uncultured Sphingomonas sp.]|uniref:DUF6445 family protein n=1 Tax=uncultured Sphingomonas sp. TaxID=158754 RepID=UPI0035CA5CE3
MTAGGIRPDIAARRIGHEAQPIVIVEGFHPDPDALRAHAATAKFNPARNHYPGLRADLPPDYFARIRPALAATLSGVFGHTRPLSLIDASYAMVTTPPAQLTRAQRLPHVDAVDPQRIALVHYLHPENRDGTAFYRHRATGYETLDADRAPAYLAALDAERRNGMEPPPGYLTGSNAQYDQVASVVARYNRAVLYRSALLHSGAIASDTVLSEDPATGRLTITAFLLLG